MAKLSVVIPVYNEKATFRTLLERVESVQVGMDKEIIIVDDHSTDGTQDLLKNLDQDKYKIILKQKNGGKGDGVKLGISAATGDYLIIQDADLEYDPNEYPLLLKPILNGEADFVMGSRISSGSIRLFGKDRSYFSSFVGSILIALFINILYGKKHTDYYGCYKAFKREILNEVEVKANGFEYDAELICKLYKKGYQSSEVPSVYKPRSFKEGKKMKWRAGFNTLFVIVYYRFFN